MCETGNQPAGHWHPVSEDDYVLHADHAAEVARLEARVAELTQLHADACFDRNLAQTERDSLRAQLEAAKLRLGYYAEGHDLAAPAPACKTCGDTKVVGHAHLVNGSDYRVKPCPDCTPTKEEKP